MFVEPEFLAFLAKNQRFSRKGGHGGRHQPLDATANLDTDGIVGINDFLLLLGNWG